MTPNGPTFVACLGVLPWAPLVCGQELAAIPPVANVTSQTRADGETNNASLFGPSSGDNSFSHNARPFQLVLPREHLFGDWFGSRRTLEDAGITPTLTYVIDIAGNVSGGKSRGVTEASNLGLDLLFDFEKLFGLQGGSFLVSMSQRWGQSLSKERIGNVFTVQQVYGGQTFHLIDLAYQQTLFEDRIEFRAGRIATGDDFLVSAYNWLFMQNGFDGNPVGVFFNSPGMTAYPNATWGTRVKVKPTDRTYVMGGVYNGDSFIRANDHHGADMSMDGPLFAIGEFAYQLNGLPGDSPRLGNYKAGFWYDNHRYTDFKTVGFGGAPRTERGNWGFYTMFDQVLVPFGAPGSNRGFGITGSFLVSPDDSVSQMPYFFTLGLAARGIISSRPIDVAGFGLVYGRFSDDLRYSQERQQELDPAVGVQSQETVLEWTYRFYFRKGAFFFQPDIQYVMRPGGTGHLDDALVLGCQIGINF